MPKAFTPKVVTANDLLEGDVIYLTADDRWSRRLEEAEGFGGVENVFFKTFVLQ